MLTFVWHYPVTSFVILTAVVVWLNFFVVVFFFCNAMENVLKTVHSFTASEKAEFVSRLGDQFRDEDEDLRWEMDELDLRVDTPRFPRSMFSPADQYSPAFEGNGRQRQSAGRGDYGLDRGYQRSRVGSGRGDLRTPEDREQDPYPVFISHAHTPRVSFFSGEQDGKDCSYPQWRYEVDGLLQDRFYSESAILQGVRHSLKGMAAGVVRSMGNVAVIDILSKMDELVGNILATESLLEQFFSCKQEEHESITAWACRLDEKRSVIRARGTQR